MENLQPSAKSRLSDDLAFVGNSQCLNASGTARDCIIDEKPLGLKSKAKAEVTKVWSLSSGQQGATPLIPNNQVEWKWWNTNIPSQLTIPKKFMVFKCFTH